MSAIDAVGLRKVYGDHVAVADLTLTVREGEVYGLLGPNGAGKTTTVKMLLDLVRPTAGRATLFGARPGDVGVMGKVGFLPEHFRFPSWMTAEGFLDTHCRLYKLADDVRRQRTGEVLERMGLEGCRRQRLGTFSKGMSQRIGLAQALLAEPALVFLDEPTSALDPIGRREVRDVIRELRSSGVTVFLNSHLLSEVEVTCDRVGIMKEGRMVREGSLAELTGSEIEVDVRASGLSAETIAALGRWGVVRDVEAGRLTVAVEGDEVLPELARTVVESGGRLYALTPKRLSLEELFVRIVGDDS